jgi:hypothetical protein
MDTEEIIIALKKLALSKLPIETINQLLGEKGGVA